MNRILVPKGPERYARALAIGIKSCKEAGAAELALITPLKDDLDSLQIGKFLGKPVSQRLMKGDKIPVGDHGISLAHFSVSTVQDGRTPAVGVAFYVTKEGMRKLDDLHFVTLVMVPWIEEEGVEWARKWGASTSGGPAITSEIDLPPAVLKALADLTMCVNLSTGLGHPSDMQHAKRKFSGLRAAGTSWNPTEIEKWAVRNGWRTGDATELSKLSSKYV